MDMFNKKAIEKIKKNNKLNVFQKIAIKKVIKEAKKMINKYQDSVVDEVKEREMLEKELLSFLDILEIETEDGVSLDKVNIKTFSNKQLEDTFVQSLNEMEKLI